MNFQRLRERAEEIYVEDFSGGVAIENQTVLAEACARDMAKAYEQAFREMLKEASTVEPPGGQPEVPEYVDLAKLYEAQKIMRAAPHHFCDQCGATNPKHGFYPLHHSHVVWNRQLVGSVSSVTCNCCHGTEKNPCPYCAEEEKTGASIDVRANPG